MSGVKARRYDYHALTMLIDGMDDGALSAMLGLSRSTIYRYRTHGLTLAAADRLAVALGTHPALIWPDMYKEAS